MSAITSPAHAAPAAPPAPSVAAAPRAPALRLPRAVTAAGRTLALCALVLLVPGEAERVLERLPRD